MASALAVNDIRLYCVKPGIQRSLVLPESAHGTEACTRQDVFRVSVPYSRTRLRKAVVEAQYMEVQVRMFNQLRDEITRYGLHTAFKSVGVIRVIGYHCDSQHWRFPV